MVKVNNFKAILPVFGLYLFLCVCLFPGVFFKNQTFIYGDNLSLIIPNKILAANSLKVGKLPFWNPDSLGGIPFLADISTSLFYPSTILYYFLSPSLATNVNVIFHLWLSAIGVYFCARALKSSHMAALIAGGVWLLSEHLISSANNFATLQSMTYLPWITGLVVLASSRNSVKIASFLPIFWAMAILGGLPQPVIYTFILALSFLLIVPQDKKILQVGVFLLSVIIGLGITSMILIPFIDYVTHSTRMGMSLFDVLHGSAHPLHLGQLIFPNLYSYPPSGISWGPDWGRTRETGAYLSLIGLISIVYYFARKWRGISREDKWLLLSGVTALIFSMAGHIPPIVWLFNNVPLMSYVRSPSGITVIWIFAASILIGKSVLYLTKTLNIGSKRLLLLLMLVLGLLAVLAGYDFWFSKVWGYAAGIFPQLASENGFHTIQKDYAIGKLILTNMIFPLVIAWLILWLTFIKKSVWWVVGLIWLDLLVAAQATIFLGPNNLVDSRTSPQAMWLKVNLTANFRFLSLSDYIPFTGLMAYVNDMTLGPPFAETRFNEAEKKSYRELRARLNNLTPNWHLAYDLPSVYGISTLIPSQIANYWQGSGPKSAINSVDKVDWDDDRLNQMGVKYLLADHTITDPLYLAQKMPNFRVAKQEALWTILENTNAKPIVNSTLKSPISNIVVDTQHIQFDHIKDEWDAVELAMYADTNWACGDRDGCSLKFEEMKLTAEIGPDNKQVVLKYIPFGWPWAMYTSIGFGLIYLAVWLGAYLKRYN